MPAAEPRPGAAPRAYVVESWRRVDDPNDAVDQLIAPDFEPRLRAIENATPGAPPLPSSTPNPAPNAPGRVVRVRHEWNRVEVDVDVARPCLLVLCETWLPGWTARADGEERTVARVDAVFRGVALRPGDRRVAMVYEAPWFRAGAIGSCAATVLLIAGLVACRTRARRLP
jgi:hypothetical protein